MMSGFVGGFERSMCGTGLMVVLAGLFVVIVGGAAAWWNHG